MTEKIPSPTFDLVVASLEEALTADEVIDDALRDRLLGG
jgi:hypothetical protein